MYQTSVLTLLSNGLALCTNYARTTFYDMRLGKINKHLTNSVCEAYDYVCIYDAALVTSGELDPRVYNFRSKNFYGMKDVTTVEANVEAGATSTPANEQALLDSVPDIEVIQEVVD